MVVAAPAKPRSQLQLNKGHTETRETTIFRPPPSPVPSSWSDSRQRPNSRKRSRPSSPSLRVRNTPPAEHVGRPDGYFDTHTAASLATTWSCITPNASFEPGFSQPAPSPLPFGEARYGTAYGIHTSQQERYNGDSDIEWRTRAAGERRWDETQPAERSTRPRKRPSEPNGAPSVAIGITSLVVGVVSNVAGRMLEFCKQSVPFTGFYAGGGQGFALAGSQASNACGQSSHVQGQELAGFLEPCSPFELVNASIPGQYPESPPQEPSAKRKRGDGAGWVLVPAKGQGGAYPPENTSLAHEAGQSQLVRRTSSVSSTRQSGPLRQSRRSVAPTMVARRHSSNATHAGSPLSRGRNASTASSRAGSLAASPTGSKDQRSSSHSRSSVAFGLRNEAAKESLSPDAQRYQARIKRQEREQDKSMRQMNAKLQALIAEGQAALGSRIDVELDGLDLT